MQLHTWSHGLQHRPLTAAGMKAGFIGRLFMLNHVTAKTISAAGGGKIHWPVWSNSWAGASSCTIGFQGLDVSALPAKPNGTFTASSTFIGGTLVNNSGQQWVSSDIDTGSVTFNHGDLISVVVDLTAQAGADRVQPNSVFIYAIGGTSHYAYKLEHDGANWGNPSGEIWHGVIEFDDGSFACMIPEGVGSMAQDTHEFQESSNPDERGNLFQLPFDCEVDAFVGQMKVNDQNSDFTLKLYSDPTGTPTLIASVTVEAAAARNNSDYAWGAFPFAPVALSRNTDYVVAMKATGTSNCGLLIPVQYTSVSSPFGALFRDGVLKGATRNNNTGAFTVADPILNNYALSLRVSALNDGAGGGGGGGSVTPLGSGLHSIGTGIAA